MINVYDDWLQPELKNILKNTFNSSNLPWYLPSSKWSTVAPEIRDKFKNDERVIDSPMMVHPVIIQGYEQHTGGHETLLMYLIESFFEKLSDTSMCVEIHRMKANLQHKYPCSKPIFFNSPHIDHTKDIPKDHFAAVCLYYIDDSDGDTFFFDDEWNIIQRVTPKAGRMVLFKNEVYHASSPPQQNGGRIVLNTNVFLPNKVRNLII